MHYRIKTYIDRHNRVGLKCSHLSTNESQFDIGIENDSAGKTSLGHIEEPVFGADIEDHLEIVKVLNGWPHSAGNIHHVLSAKLYINSSFELKTKYPYGITLFVVMC